MKYALLIITDGRADYLARTLESFHPNVTFKNTAVVDDSTTEAGLDLALSLGDEFGSLSYSAPDRKLGGAGAIRMGWETARKFDVDYIFHLEDDWCFPHAVDVEAMAWVLERNETMANIVLRRQPWGNEGPDGYIGDNPTAFTEHTTLSYNRAWLSHTRGFWLNPCLYRRSLIEEYEWPEHGHEHHFTEQLAVDGWHYGVLGRKQDPPRCIHIGNERSPQWEW